jgi:hypothetical protein
MTTLAVVGPAVIKAGTSLSDAIDCTGSTRIVRVIAAPHSHRSRNRLTGRSRSSVRCRNPVPAAARRQLGWAGKTGAVRLAQLRGCTVAVWRGAWALPVRATGVTGHP